MAEIDKEMVNQIKEYYEILGKEVLISDSTIHLFFTVISAHRGAVVVSDNKVIRAIAKLRGIGRVTKEKAASQSLYAMALCDALALLQKKGIPVFFYNRIGMIKEEYHYRASEERRIHENLDFPKMYENPEQYSDDFKEILGKLYSPEYIEKLGQIPQVIRVGDHYCHEDAENELIHVKNGERIVKGQPEFYNRTIHVYGRCGVFGYAVEDADSLPSLLQAEFQIRGYSELRVVNHGLWGGLDEYLDYNFINDAVNMRPGDVVLFYRKHFDKKLLNRFSEYGVYYKELTEEWHLERDNSITFYNQPGHMNADGYRLVAKLITDDLLKNDFLKPISVKESKIIDISHIKRFLHVNANVEFQREIDEYIETVKQNVPSNIEGKCGAIVMNCNPFTIGHKYLIDTAAGKVDTLYIFVVEEDRSVFKFEDRMEMVKQGTKDLNNVVVVPSGKFIISAYTFPEYFMKDYVKEKDFDVSMDIETFCKYIAPPLNIVVRFAGEEPFDPVTKNYNESMKKILPNYGMSFQEIPRFAIDEDRIINATRVRELLKEGNIKELEKYVPASTLYILKDKYMFNINV